jgi:N-acetylated-alpha-linked acidic dipeptidase
LLDGEKTAAEKDFKDKLSKLPKPAHSGNRALYWLKKLMYDLLGLSDPWKEFIKAAKRVQASNAKLISFEKGFLHKDGIKDREWYRHLGVAPGKWLGAS